jgi:hypothetical protein
LGLGKCVGITTTTTTTIIIIIFSWPRIGSFNKLSGVTAVTILV